MHVYFSGIGGAGIGPLALIAKQAGYEVSGSDIKDSAYTKYLAEKGISIHVGQTAGQIAEVHQRRPIDWFVYSSALPMTDPDHPELKFCEQNGIKATKRDELINQIVKDKGLKLIAIAGTHGKTTTTAMLVWLFKQSGVPVSYSVGAKLSFGEPGEYVPDSRYFIYEADEFDRNFLNFYPEIAVISGIDWDHPDIYPTREAYDKAFLEFIGQSRTTVLWHKDFEKLGLEKQESLVVLDDGDPDLEQVKLAGLVNRQNALLACAAYNLTDRRLAAIEKINRFPGLSRRFEEIASNIYSDYAHTPEKIRGALQMAQETAGDNVVVVYEGLHNTRQHFIKDDLADLFKDAKQLYIVPSYLAREDKSLELLTPEKLLKLLTIQTRGKAAAAELNDDLKRMIDYHARQGDLVLALSAGGAGSLDEWLRQEFA